MAPDTGMATRLRAAGLTVREVQGWKQRNNGGTPFNPRGFVVHHTAGPRPSSGSRAPCLGICVNGRSDLPGPLCNLYMDFDGVVYTVAAGSANHAGRPDGGMCRGMAGNSHAWGFEIEHPGTAALEDKRAEIAARAIAAVIKGTCDESQVVLHKEWAPSRKIDLATSPGAHWWRTRVGFYLTNAPSKEDGVDDWIMPWVAWYIFGRTDTPPKPRPKGAPREIPKDAWEVQKQVAAMLKQQGAHPAYQDWRDWHAKGQDAETRPESAPKAIYDEWWVAQKRDQAYRAL